MTNSIENEISEEIFDTLIFQIKDITHVKKADWGFNWKAEIKDKSKVVFKLTTVNNPTIVHELIN